MTRQPYLAIVRLGVMFNCNKRLGFELGLMVVNASLLRLKCWMVVLSRQGATLCGTAEPAGPCAGKDGH